jgi:Glycosyltransferase family 87
MRLLRGVPGDWAGLVRRGAGIPLLLAGLAVAFFLGIWGRPVRSGEFLIGDCPYYASTAVSLWVDGDLDLRNQLRGGLEVHQRQVALGRRGEWFPKHPILMPVFSIPFYALFGVAGFLLFNVLDLGLLGIVIWLFCRRYVSGALATLATTGILGGTFLRAYVYNYSPDVFSTLLFMGGLYLLLRGRPLPAGMLLGLSVMAKITNLFSLSIVAGFLLFGPRRREAWRLTAAALPCLLGLALLNAHMFGSPATTGYDRTLVLENGEAVTISHRGFFDLPVLEGIRGQLFAERTGLLSTSPLLLLAVPGFVLLLRRNSWEGLLFLCLGEFTFLLFSTYRWWATSHYGNRFLMIPVALCAVPLALTLGRMYSALRPRAEEPLLVPATLRGK